MQYYHYRTTIIMLLIFSFVLISQGLSAQEDRAAGKLFGTITDQTTKTPLFGASVSVVGTQRGAMAKDNGEYSIDQIPPGTYNIRFSMIGYKALVRPNVTISPGRGTEISVSLELEAVEVEGVTVTAKESYFEKNPEAEVSGRTMDATEIMNSAGSAMDVQRVVQVLPSVVSGADQFNEIIVRGGNFNENLFVMDGIEIPNPNHFAFQGAGGGPISILRAEFINDVNFFAGAFPANSKRSSGIKSFSGCFRLATRFFYRQNGDSPADDPIPNRRTCGSIIPGSFPKTHRSTTGAFPTTTVSISVSTGGSIIKTGVS